MNEVEYNPNQNKFDSEEFYDKIVSLAVSSSAEIHRRKLNATLPSFNDITRHKIQELLKEEKLDII